MGLVISQTAPNLEATTQGRIGFRDRIAGSGSVLFSHSKPS